MKKIFAVCCMIFALCAGGGARAYQLQSSRELGRDDARNQNIVVTCTTTAGKTSSNSCQLRRYASCKASSTGKKKCHGWQPWQDVRNPGTGYGDWRAAADACCREKGLR